MNLSYKRPVTIGRELDQKLAILTGEAAQQKIRHPQPEKGTYPVPLWRQVPSFPEGPQNDYFHLPLLKEPVWIWSVPAYFYMGGVAGGAALLVALLKGKETRGLASACRLLAFIGTTISPALLTWDLGRKFRFLNMLRVFRPSSPMSVGSWTLAGSGALATLALLQGEGFPRQAALALAGGGTILAGYTGVLLSNTANPVWHASRRTLPVLFTASAIASTSAVLEMIPLNEQEERVVKRFGAIGKVAEAASMVVMEWEAAREPETAQALETGSAGRLWKGAKVLLAAGVAVSFMPGRSPWKRRLGGILTTVGAVCLRYALMQAGKEAARNPQAVIRRQLQGQ